MTFKNGEELSNKISGLALGVASYECRPGVICSTMCYGLKLSGNFNYYMLILAVLASKSALSVRDWSDREDRDCEFLLDCLG